jgi:glutamine amidotransferase
MATERVRVGIVDYESGNIRSVANAVEHAGGEVTIVTSPGDMSGLTHLVLPGVGAFGFCDQGLGWMGGVVRPLEKPAGSDLRIPHVGWNAVTFAEAFGQFRAGESADFYFDHSYALDMPTKGRRVGVCEHGRAFSALVVRDNIVAAQFHPEKSQAAGMKLLQSFFAA